MKTPTLPPCDEWCQACVERYGELYASGELTLFLSVADGPMAHEARLPLPHIDWRLWVEREPYGTLEGFATPPNSVPDRLGVFLGYYVFDRVHEELTFVAVGE